MEFTKNGIVLVLGPTAEKWARDNLPNGKNMRLLEDSGLDKPTWQRLRSACINLLKQSRMERGTPRILLYPQCSSVLELPSMAISEIADAVIVTSADCSCHFHKLRYGLED